jgi:hypothetical protein
VIQAKFGIDANPLTEQEENERKEKMKDAVLKMTLGDLGQENFFRGAGKKVYVGIMDF